MCGGGCQRVVVLPESAHDFEPGERQEHERGEVCVLLRVFV